MGNECWSAVAKWSYFSHYIYCGVPFKEEEEEEAKQKRRYRSASSRRTLSFKLDRAQKVCLLFWLGSHVTRWWFSAPTVFSAAIGCWPYLYTPAHSFFPPFSRRRRRKTPNTTSMSSTLLEGETGKTWTCCFDSSFSRFRFFNGLSGLDWHHLNIVRKKCIWVASANGSA